MRELLSIPYSPWSEKARWALDARGVDYQKRAYQPLLGEPALRVLLRRPFGRVSVPVLIDGKHVINESFKIARYADELGSGPRLFPEGREAAIVDFDAASERALAAGRALALTRMLDDREALEEKVPRAMRKLGPVAIAIARAGVERTLRKYGAGEASLADHHAMLASVLISLRADLSRSRASEPRTLFATFSYADIVMSQALCFVQPPESAHFRIGSGSRRCYCDAELNAQFGDLVAWRDALYARYRDARPLPASVVSPANGAHG